MAKRKQQSEWRFFDKSAWRRGPWDDEPDKMQWRDTATGLSCLIHRNAFGVLCGYVGVPPTHALHGTAYHKVRVEVHGGLTFSDSCAETSDEGAGICHVAEPGESDAVWWFGFDCNHCFDFAPATNHQFQGSTYKDIAYVRAECAKLAQQLAAV